MMSARRTRHPALANSLSASVPPASSPVNPPTPSPPRQRAAPSVSRRHLDRTQTPSAPLPLAPALLLRSHKPRRRPNPQDSASPRLWAAVGVHSASRQRSAEEMPLVSPRPLVVAVRLANLRALDRLQEVASARPQHWVSRPAPSVLPVLVNRPSPPNLRRLVASVSPRSWAPSRTRLPLAAL